MPPLSPHLHSVRGQGGGLSRLGGGGISPTGGAEGVRLGGGSMRLKRGSMGVQFTDSNQGRMRGFEVLIC
jgi:hypothetical protein